MSGFIRQAKVLLNRKIECLSLFINQKLIIIFICSFKIDIKDFRFKKIFIKKK